jgi:hypothetical protein
MTAELTLTARAMHAALNACDTGLSRAVTIRTSDCPRYADNMDMGNPTAPIICAILIAAAILAVFRFEVVVNTGLIYRLDRWTGGIRVCIKQNPEDPYIVTCFKQGEATYAPRD